MMMRMVTVVLIASSLWALSSAAYIEYKNAKADYFLPRQDVNEDGTWRDGKWRISAISGHPRDSLRGVVGSLGLIQYPLCFGMIIGVIMTMQSERLRQNQTIRWLCLAAFMSAVIGLGLAMYRGYFTSLG